MAFDFRQMLMLRLEIDALNAEFAYLIDHDQSEGVADLFTEDGVYGRSTGQRSTGREAIRDSYRLRKDAGVRTARHIFSNLRLTPISDTQLRGSVILTLFAEDGPPPHPAEPLVIADYDDIYELSDDGRWRYRERIISWIFVREGARSPLALGASPSSSAPESQS
jgi:ketosteroid isomerase-like protein